MQDKLMYKYTEWEYFVETKHCQTLFTTKFNPPKHHTFLRNICGSLYSTFKQLSNHIHVISIALHGPKNPLGWKCPFEIACCPDP